MAQTTLADLESRARSAIERREQIVYDVADEHAQMVGNVAHMRWFINAVMDELAQRVGKYNHLINQVPD